MEANWQPSSIIAYCSDFIQTFIQTFLWSYRSSLRMFKIALHETTWILLFCRESCCLSSDQSEVHFSMNTGTLVLHTKHQPTNWKCRSVSRSNPLKSLGHYCSFILQYRFGITVELKLMNVNEYFPVFTQQRIPSLCSKNQALYLHVCLFWGVFCLLVFTFLAECIAVCFFCSCACACACACMLLLLSRWQPALAVVSQIVEDSLAKASPCHLYSLPWRESRAPRIWAQVLTLTDTFSVNTDWEEYKEKCSATGCTQDKN